MAASSKYFHIDASDHWVFLNSKTQAPLPDQGWKVHVSCTSTRFSECLLLITDLAIQHHFSFKHIRDLFHLQALNAGQLGDTQAGKCFTLYFESWTEAATILLLIRAEFQDRFAPKIPTDFYYDPNDAVAVRYGAFTSTVKEDRVFGEAKGQDGPPSIAGVPLRVHPCFQKPEHMILAGSTFRLRSTQGRPMKPIWILEKKDGGTMAAKVAFAGFGPDTSFASDLEYEYAQLKSIEDIDIAPRAFEIATDAWNTYLCMEALTGDSLERLPLEFCKEKFICLLDLVDALRQKSLAHLDLKLANIFLDVRHNKLKLIDFELSQPLGTPLRSSAGTPGYIAPTRVAGAPVTTEMDLYSLGVILAHLCLGREPALLSSDAKELILLVRSLGFHNAAEVMETLFFPTHDAAWTCGQLRRRLPHTNLFARLRPERLRFAVPMPVPQPTDIRRMLVHDASMLDSIGLTGWGGRLLAGAPTPDRDWDGLTSDDNPSLEKGWAGLLFGAAQAGRRDLIQRIDRRQLNESTIKLGPGLFRGQAGVLLALHAAADALGEASERKQAHDALCALARGQLQVQQKSCIRKGVDSLYWVSGLTGVLWAYALVSATDSDAEAFFAEGSRHLLERLLFLGPSLGTGLGGMLDLNHELCARFPQNTEFEDHRQILSSYAIASFQRNRKDPSLYYGSQALGSILTLGALRRGSLFRPNNIHEVRA